jgi:hypothetical protein
MRLVYRDKGCAVCLAAGVKLIYKYCEDFNRFEGAHIIGLAYQRLVSHSFSFTFLKPDIIIKWNSRGFSSKISDPFTDPFNASNMLASLTTQTKRDPGRINSLENGILLCLQHYKDYNEFCFSIHPNVSTCFLPYSI